MIYIISYFVVINNCIGKFFSKNMDMGELLFWFIQRIADNALVGKFFPKEITSFIYN